MPKKNAGRQTKTLATKKTTRKSVPIKKAVAVRATTGNSLTPAKRTVAKENAVTKAFKKANGVSTNSVPVLNSPSLEEEISLGRPLVTQEEKLYMLFHDDYRARQVFEFLRVETVKELEQFSQQQIIHMMSKPLRMTVDRIRQRLAQFKRSLKDDEQFAVDFMRRTNE